MTDIAELKERFARLKARKQDLQKAETEVAEATGVYLASFCPICKALAEKFEGLKCTRHGGHMTATEIRIGRVQQSGGSFEYFGTQGYHCIGGK